MGCLSDSRYSCSFVRSLSSEEEAAVSDNSSSKSQGRRRALIQVSAAILSVLAVTAVPISVNLWTDAVVKGGQWLFSDAAWLSVAALLLAVISGGFTYRLTKYARKSTDDALKLLKEFNELERAAKGVLDETDSASPIRIRSSLAALGIWSKEDVVAFDAAVRVRNSLVHGDEEFDRASVDGAITTMYRLREKLLKQAQ
jgi:hypothetical protein